MVSLLMGVSGSRGEAQTSASEPVPGAARIELGCQNPGSPQETGKTPVITNTAAKTLTKDQRIAWAASDGDSGEMTLQEEMPQGAKLLARGKPGSSYSCQAYALG